MAALRKLKKSAEGKPYYGFTHLETGYHKIFEFRLIKNGYAEKGDKNQKSLLVELKDEILFLPKHFSTNMNNEDIEELNTDGEEKFLFFGGKRKNK